MKIIEQSHEILNYTDPKMIELAGRVCYKTEEKITDDSYKAFIRMLLGKGHGAMLEHGFATVKFITNRGVTHELVRHRMASFGQESTRYVNYKSDDIQFIKPVWMVDEDNMAAQLFISNCASSENCYRRLMNEGWKPQQAREVLPNSLKTEIIMTANYREWLHVMCLRALGTTGTPHPQMQALMIPLLSEFKEKIPSIFGSLGE